MPQLVILYQLMVNISKGRSMSILVEICCGSFHDAKNAYLGGARQIELNSGLFLGGLTPSLASLRQIKESLPLKVIAMVRPRGGGFCYHSDDIKIMLEDAHLLLEAGADGLAFGFLQEDYKIHLDPTRRLLELVKSYQKEAVFHRAFDCCQDPFQTIELCITLGFHRILTSGMAATALDGIPLLARLEKEYGKEIEILAGCGLNETNAKDFILRSCITKIHSSCKEWIYDPTTSLENVSYGYANAPYHHHYDIVSTQKVQALIRAIGKENEYA